MRFLIFTIIVMGLFSGWLRGAGYHDESSGLVFPDAVGTLRRGKETKYETEPNQGGVAVPYESADAEVTIYIRHIPKDVDMSSEAALKDALAGVKELEARGQYSDVKIYLFDQKRLRPGWMAAAFTSQSEARFIVSFIYCKTRPGFLFKVRATTGNPKNDKLTADLDALMKVIDADEKRS